MELNKINSCTKNRNFDHVMVDIETLGSESNSAILSIAAVKFDIKTGGTGETFNKNISLDSCLEAGLLINASTIKWWMTNSTDAQKALFENTLALEVVLNDFNNFVSLDTQIWGNSARFDLGILQNAYNKLKLPIPWDFRKERCLRTLVSFNPSIKENHVFKDVKHNAFDDCMNQIEYAVKIWNTINIIEKNVPEQHNPLRTSGLSLPCTCACHRQNGITHIVPCCNNGYV